MSEHAKLNYITKGFRWAWGWGLYEARTMRWLVVILLIALLLGLTTGIVISLLAELSGWAAVGAVVASLIAFVFLGVVFARGAIPFVWSFMQTRGMEE